MTEFKCSWARLQPVLRGGCGYFVLTLPEMRIRPTRASVDGELRREGGLPLFSSWHIIQLWMEVSPVQPWALSWQVKHVPFPPSIREPIIWMNSNFSLGWRQGKYFPVSCYKMKYPWSPRQVMTNKILRWKDCVCHPYPSGPGGQICRRRDGARRRAERGRCSRRRRVVPTVMWEKVQDQWKLTLSRFTGQKNLFPLFY